MKLEHSANMVAHAARIADIRLNRVGVQHRQPQLPVLTPDLKLRGLLGNGGLTQLFVSFHEIDYSHNLPGRVGECYKYALRAFYNSREAEYIYCEGFACSKRIESIPLEHAWLVRKSDGHIIDPVWKGKNKGVGYCGLPMHPDFVTSVVIKTERYGILSRLHSCQEMLDTTLQKVVHPLYHNALWK